MESIRYTINSEKTDDSSCYKLEKIVFNSNSAILDIDATYIIHL